MTSEKKIYVLIDPITLKIRYIGTTNQSLKDRLYGHIGDAKNRPEINYHKTNWIKKIQKSGLKPIIKLLKICETREEAEKLEEKLINKYKEKHDLINISLDSGKFDTTSAGEFLSKEVFVYDYQGNYIKSFKSIKECSYELDIYYSTIKKCLYGEYKYAKKYQFSFEKVEKMLDLTEYSTGSSKEVLLLDTYTDDIIRFKSKVDCCNKLQLIIKSTGHKYLLGALNQCFGNRYMMLVDGQWQQSTYYNTGIIINYQDKVITYLSKKEFLESLGYSKSVTINKFQEIINSKFSDASEIKLEQPQYEVIRIRTLGEFRESP